MPVFSGIIEGLVHSFTLYDVYPENAVCTCLISNRIAKLFNKVIQTDETKRPDYLEVLRDFAVYILHVYVTLGI